MFTDLILLVVLFGLIGGILVFVTSLSTPPTSTQVGKSSIDWNKGEVKLRTSMRPVTQQDLLEQAEQKGQQGGMFVSQHAQSFSFGKKDS